jgi:UDP-N-acetylmuramyl tripeptide synthase
MTPPRALAALWAGKATAALSRGLRRGGGTTLPGDVARFVDPRILVRLGARLDRGSIVVTGTNGKTTTAALLRHILQHAGIPVIANRSGANLIFGVTAAVLDGTGWGGRLGAQAGLFEIDEASLPRVVEEIRPRAVVVLNLFRDQLDRYGELEHTAALVGQALRALPPGARAVLNADDPRVAALGEGLKERVLFFGLEDPAVGTERLPHAADARFCPRCGAGLTFSRVFLGHLGIYCCPRGDFARPLPGIRGEKLVLRGMDRLDLTLAGEPASFSVPLSGTYNAYNVLAALAAAQAMGIPAAQAGSSLANFEPAFGRLERLHLAGHPVYLMLAKNPTGFNEVLRTALDLGQGRDFLLAINDRIADGQDISWLWDVDFELLGSQAERLTVAGDRAQDMALRVKYAEVPADRLEIVPASSGHWTAAWDRALQRTPEGEALFVLPTYTAMLELRRVLVGRGLVKPFWR